MAKYKIEVDKDTCIGCGACTATCGDLFEMGDDHKAQVKGGESYETDDPGCAQDAAEGCPVNAIHLYEDGEKKI